MTVVKMYPRIKFLGTFDPRYANIVESTSQIRPRDYYIELVGGWFCVFRKTETGRLRRGNYKSLLDAVYAAHCKK